MNAATAFLAIALAAAPGAAQDAAPVDPSKPAGPPDPPASTEWHREPVLEKRIGKNVVVYNHADATLETATIVELLQRQYDWLAEYVGLAPRWVLVHVGSRYPLGFMIRNGPDPEMFLQANGIFDTANNYAHEMMHCFLSELGPAIPHWFNESASDVAYIAKNELLVSALSEAAGEELLPLLKEMGFNPRTREKQRGFDP